MDVEPRQARRPTRHLDDAASTVHFTKLERQLHRVVDSLRLGELAEAHAQASTIAKLARKAKDTFALGRALLFIAEADLLSGEIQKGEARCHEAMRVSRRIFLWGNVSRLHRLLALAAEQRGDWATARQHLQEALETAERVPNRGGEADIRARNLFETYLAITALCIDQERWDEANEHLRHAEAFAAELSDPLLLGDYLTVKSRIELTNDPQRALELLHKAQRIYSNNRLPIRAASAYETEGLRLLAEGDVVTARRILSRALKILDRAQSPTSVRIQRVLDEIAATCAAASAAARPHSSGRHARNVDRDRNVQASSLSLRAIGDLLDPTLRFGEFCERLTKLLVDTFAVAHRAFVVQDFGGGSFRMLAAFPAGLEHEELFAQTAEVDGHRHVGLWNAPDVVLHLRADPAVLARPSTTDLLTLVERISRSRISDEVISELEGNGWPDRSGVIRFGLLVASLEMHAVLERVSRVAQSDCTVLITGESGTGKERLARATHDASARATQPFRPTNCATGPAELVESKLFGHRRGAFTGASTDNPGLFRSAHLGTLFLDEIGEIPLTLQAKLLRVLDSGEIEPIGSTSPVRVDTRVIAATNRTLEKEVARGRFREDLYHRLNVVTVTIPPLRERPADILPLAYHFLECEARTRPGSQPIGIQPAAERALLEYPWPGNVRELRNKLAGAVLLNGFRTVRLSDLGFTRGERNLSLGTATSSPAAPTRYDDVVNEARRTAILNALNASEGSRAEACRRLELTRSKFYRLAERLAIDLDAITPGNRIRKNDSGPRSATGDDA